MMSWFPAHCVHPIVGWKNVKDNSKHKTLIVLEPEKHSKNSTVLFSSKPASCRQSTKAQEKKQEKSRVLSQSKAMYWGTTVDSEAPRKKPVPNNLKNIWRNI